MSNLITEAQHHIDRAGEILFYTIPHPTNGNPIIKEHAFAGFRAGVLSFIQKRFGTSHSYYSEFATKVVHANEEDTKRAMEILKTIKREIERSGGVLPKPIGQSNAEARMLGLKQEVFWPLCVAMIAGSFILGFHLGGAKFDSDKIKMYESNKALLHKDSVQTVQIQRSNQVIKKLEDSVKLVNHQLKAVLTYGTQPTK